MTLLAKNGRGVYATRRPYPVKDLAALAQLQRRYTALRGAGLGVHRWTREGTLELGRLYTQAYGVLPTPGRCDATWCLPDHHPVKRLWGTFGAFVEAIAQEPQP